MFQLYSQLNDFINDMVYRLDNFEQIKQQLYMPMEVDPQFVALHVALMVLVALSAT